MKPEIHPEYNHVVYIDVSTGDEIVTRSTQTSEKTRDIDGVTHFVITCDITSFTHPFYTGKQKLLDSEGRIDRFRKKYAKFQGAPAAPAAETAPPPEPAAQAADEPAVDEAADADEAGDTDTDAKPEA